MHLQQLLTLCQEAIASGMDPHAPVLAPARDHRYRWAEAELVTVADDPDALYQEVSGEPGEELLRALVIR